jgi:hypothetical protein
MQLKQEVSLKKILARSKPGYLVHFFLGFRYLFLYLSDRKITELFILNNGTL